MGKAQDLDAIEAALKTHLADEWYIEKSLRFNGITTDLLLVHPERGVILIGLMNVAKDFDFESYNKRRKEVAEAFFKGESKEAQPEEPALNAGWEGMADPRDVFVDCRSELLDFFKEFTEENVKRLLSTVLIVVQDSDAVEKNIVLGNTWSKNQKAILIDWLRENPVDLPADEMEQLVYRLVPQAFTIDYPMPTHVWDRLKREVLGIEDAVLGMAPPPDFRFDKKQNQVLEYLRSPGLKRFQGPAGSGKTLIIARQVADCINAGGTVLVVVCNKTMCQMIQTRALFFINEGITDTKKRIENTRKLNQNSFITWQDRWWQRTCAATNLSQERDLVYMRADDSKNDDKRAVAEKKLASLTFTALTRATQSGVTSLQYDVVIADEAQNMFPENWEGLKLSAKSDTGIAVVSSDPTQSLYGSRPWTEAKMKGFANNPWRKLNASYRLPDDYLAFVADFVEKFPPAEDVNLPMKSPQMALAQSTLYRVAAEFPKDAIAKGVEFALNILGFAPHQIVVLVPTNRRGEAAVAELRKRGIAVTHTFDENLRPVFGLDTNVRASSFHSYAGWESPCVIVDTNFSEKQTNTNDLLYSGLTRLAKRDLGSALILVEGDNQYRGMIREYCEEIQSS